MNTQQIKYGMTWGLLAILLGGTATAARTAPSSGSNGKRPTATAAGNTGFGWLGRMSLTPDTESRFDVARDVAFDANHYVYAAGTVRSDAAFAEFSVAKWYPTGQRQWVRTLTGTAGPGGTAVAIEVDASGDVLAAGQIGNTDTLGDFAVARWDPLGNLEWSRSVSGVGFDNAGDAARALTIDGAGDVVAVGQLGTEVPNFGTMRAGAVVKLNGADGTVRWQRLLGDPASNSHELHTVAVDSHNDVVVAGILAGADNNSTFRVVKLDGTTGEVLWTASLDDPDVLGGGEEVNRVVVDANDNVLVCGTLLVDSGWEMAVAKFAGADGTVLWQRTPALPEAPADGHSEGWTLAVTSDGDVIATGTEYNSGGGGLVFRLDGETGAQEWVQRDPNGSTSVDLALGPGDTVITTGTGDDGNGIFATLTVRQFAADGTPLSTHRLPSANFRSQAFAVAVDALGNIAAAGSIQDNFISESALVAYIDCTAPTGVVESVLPRVVPYTGGPVQFSVSALDNAAIGSVTVQVSGADSALRTVALVPSGGSVYSGSLSLPGNLTALPVGYTVGVVIRDTSGNEIQLDGGGVTVAVAPAVLRVTPARLNFGKVRLGKSKRKVVTLVNAGRGELTGRIVSPEAGFSTDAEASEVPPVAFTLRPGERKRVAVYFRPAEARRYEDSLQVVLDRPEPPTIISLIGTGKASGRGGR